MSSFKVEVIQLPNFGKHPNADRLFITNIFAYPVIFNADNGYKVGDLVAYIPVDAVVPMTPEWAWLGDTARSHRIRAKKLRGIFSMGLLTPAPEGAVPGDDVAAKLGIVKYDPPEPMETGGSDERDPGFIPAYTDIQNYRRYSHLIKEGENVILTEKIHGCNARFVFHTETNRLWVGSRSKIKLDDSTNLWWKVAENYGLREKLAKAPDHIFYGEAYGQVQDLKYGAKQGECFLRFFDVYSISAGRYLNYDDAIAKITEVGLEPVPVLFRGPWSTSLVDLADGKSTLADNIREGFVVRPEAERFNMEVGRTVLKVVGQGYLLRKDGTEHH